ncbi:hypothetical protein [Capnocytophaga granulosa]|uniref:hypothetical protein n=1 Tax=Capnocytophaga granulosa TaxID=45242 RepID=UPI003857816C
MTAIDNIINQIEGETQNRGNTKTRIAAVLRLLRDKIVGLFSTKLDKGSYTGTADDLRTSIDRKVDKVPGKVLSSNDFTNELRTKLEGLRNVDISGLLPKGGYMGTAQNLKELIDNIMRIMQSPDTELDELREIVAYIKQNKRILDTLGIGNIAGLQDALNGKAPTGHNHDDRYSRLGHTHSEYAYRTHRHNWDDIDGKPAMDYIPTSWNRRNNKEVIRTQVDDWLRINELASHSNGVYFGGSVVRTDGQLQVGESGNIFRTISESNAAGIVLENKVRIRTKPEEDHVAFGDPEWTKMIYGEFAGIKIWNNVDNNKVILAGGGVATIDSIQSRVGGNIVSNWEATANWQNGVIFVRNSLNIELNKIQHMGNISFRKVFDGGQVTFTCAGKTIIYTGDNAFNGGDGSTAVVSIYGNKCYIDIRNV